MDCKSLDSPKRFWGWRARDLANTENNLTHIVKVEVRCEALVDRLGALGKDGDFFLELAFFFYLPVKTLTKSKLWWDNSWWTLAKDWATK